MAWITPVTDRLQPGLTNYVDINRIFNNANEVLGASFSTNWKNKIVDETTWNSLISAINAESEEQVTTSSDYLNLNKIETILNTLHGGSNGD